MNVRTQGFTLIELAVALFILMLLLGSIIVPLTTQVEQRKISDSRKVLDDARDALLGFAAANGRLPCPASAASNGAESFAAGGSAANGNCSNFFDGFLPAAALGLSPTDTQGYALDGWGLAQNRIRYAVSNQTRWEEQGRGEEVEQGRRSYRWRRGDEQGRSCRRWERR
jgi:prepilin-type N-terminal cleavage/methylation domain-containing protein